MKMYLFMLSLFLCGTAFAQNSISGTILDGSRMPVPGANITILGEAMGTVSDDDGKFILATPNNLPVQVEISSIGYTTQTIKVSNRNPLSVVLLEESTKLNEIVVSASRTPERIIESPVTIERMGIKDIKETTAATFYDGLENLKEVHFNTSSLSFKTVNTRGFASVGNTRFMQLVDGMDNSSPALNFILGNLIGLSELDVASVELLPGASSALYGANAFNGILFMNSKSPFTYQGVSTYFKYGKTSQQAAGTNDYYDFGFRAATAFTEKWAAKGNFTYLKGTEWIANDAKSVTSGGRTRETNQNYDGINVYGDEVSTFIPNVGQVSRTGYREQDLSDNKIESVKADFSLHFKPITDSNLELIAQYKLGLGSTIYQGANRYSLKNFFMNQIKFEIKNDNFFARAYMTGEDAGDSYDMRFAGWNVNRAWKSDQQWFTNYATAFQLAGAVLGSTADQAAGIGRQYADYNQLPAGLQGLPQFATPPTGGPRFMPGTSEFEQALAKVILNPDLKEGAKFEDNSKIYHADVNYNFKEIIKVAEIQVGGSVREYEMNSNGSIFTDYDGPIKYNEYGVYTQVTKKFLAEERLKFTGSIRYDKSENFDGSYSPRLAFVYGAGAQKRHNFRVSYQTGFRNPTTQDQYIGLDLGPFALIGSAPENLTRFVETQNVSANGQNLPGVGATVVMDGTNAYNNSYTLASVQKFGASQNPADLQVANIGLVKPERVQAFELGYRSVLENDLSIDINGYYNIYNDFLNTSRVISPYYGTVGTDMTNPSTQLTYAAIANGDRRVYQVYSNSKTEVTSVGVGIGLNKKVYADFEAGVSYNFSDFDFDAEKSPGFIPGFNTPKHRVKASLGNSKLFTNFGFNINVRWNDSYLWQSSFGDGVIKENTVLDAQVNYAFPKLKSVIKLGASNLFGEDYTQVIGAGAIGQQWFASIIINP